MVGSSESRIISMICRNEQKIRRFKFLLKHSQFLIKFFHGFTKADDIPPVAIKHIEINQVTKDEAFFSRLYLFSQDLESIGVTFGINILLDPLPCVNIGDFSNP